jgi:hypothetical protein
METSVQMDWLGSWAGFARLALFFTSSLSTITVVNAASRWATLEAIHQIENPHNSMAPGRFGELGAYQFRRETWRMHTRAPFRQALDRLESDRVAVLHYQWICEELSRRGLPVTSYAIALAWNGGIQAVAGDRATAASLDYAERAATLAAQYDRNSLADSR